MSQDLTKFMKAYNKLKILEFGDNPKKFLHQNQNEKFLTLGGVYEKYHKNIDWEFVHKILDICGNMERASVMLFADASTKSSVALFFKKEFWDKMRLDEVQSEKICNEIFLSGVHFLALLKIFELHPLDSVPHLHHRFAILILFQIHHCHFRLNQLCLHFLKALRFVLHYINQNH